MLDEFVGCVVGSSANDEGVAFSVDLDGFITNTSKPDIRQGTRTQTKDATDLLRSKDDIRDGSTIFQDKR